MKDVIDIIDESNEAIGNYINLPNKYKNSRGKDLFGYDAKELSKVLLYYNYYMKEKRFGDAQAELAQIRVSLEIEQLALYIREFYRSISHPEIVACKNREEVIIALCSMYLNKHPKEIVDIIEKFGQQYEDRWKEIVPDEDAVTEEQVDRFYNSMKFPEGAIFCLNPDNALEMAYYALPLLLVQNKAFKRIYDFGGNTGESISLIANYSKDTVCTLIESNVDAMKFAEWRNKLKGIENMEYMVTKEVEEQLDSIKGKFDFGICTEVLEHMYDVEGTVELLADLLEPGGVLYMSSSFGLYPEPSHLKKNVKYFGKEDELLQKYGLLRADVQFPIPLLSNIRVYVKNSI